VENRWYPARECGVPIDGNGNLVSDGTTNYTWDGRDRLVSNGAGYDTANLRTKMGSQQILLDGIEEAREYGPNVMRYDHDPSRVDGLLAQKTSAGKGYFVTDALGSVYGVVNSTGAEVSKYSCDVYGARTATTEGMPTNWGFTGRRHDGLADLYLRARTYDSSSGRFVSADPLGLRDGPNRYSYARSRPVSLTDPTGELVYVDENTVGGDRAAARQAITSALSYISVFLHDRFLFQEKSWFSWQSRSFDWDEAAILASLQNTYVRVSVCDADPYFKKNPLAGAFTDKDDTPGISLKVVFPRNQIVSWAADSMMMHELIHAALWNSPNVWKTARAATMLAMPEMKLSSGKYVPDAVAYEDLLTEIAAYMGEAMVGIRNPRLLERP